MDITATSGHAFQIGDSNPGHVQVSWGGVGRNIAHNLVLLGDEVELMTIFGGGLFGPVIEASCREIGMQTSHSEIASAGTNSFFVSINNADGELVGGVADMNATEGMTPGWLSARLDAINSADIVIAVDLTQNKPDDYHPAGGLMEKDYMKKLLERVPWVKWVVQRPDREKYGQNVKDADLYINPRLDDCSVTSFSKVDYMIAQGEKAGKKALRKLKKIKKKAKK